MYRVVCASLLAAVLCGCGSEPPREPENASFPIDQLPEVVTKAVKKKAPDFKANTAWKYANGDYEVNGVTKGRERSFFVSPSGEITSLE